MNLEEGRAFWRVVSAACATIVASLAFPAVVGEGVGALAILGSVTVMVRRGRASRTSRLLVAACVLLGVAPVIAEAHRAFGGSETFTVGYPVAVAGYLLATVAVHQLVRVRTVDPQPSTVVDALGLVGWAATALAFSSVERVVDQFSGLELAFVISYVPFTLALTFTAIRLALGAGERSASFLLLVVAAIVGLLSEIAFLEGAAGNAVGDRVGVMCGSLALILFAAALAHPSSASLEKPSEPSLERTSRILTGVIGASTIGVVAIAAIADLRTFQGALLLVLAMVSAARVFLIVRERDEWLGLQLLVSEHASDIGDLDESEAIVERSLAAVELLLTRKRLLFVEVCSAAELDELLFESTDPAGAMVNEVNGDLWRSLETGRIQRTEALDSETGAYSSRLVLPIDAGRADARLIVIEAAPVLSMNEIFHLEMIGAALGRSLAAVSARQRGLEKRADSRFRSLVQDSNDIVMLVDPDTLEVKLVSPTVERLLGYIEAECLGAHPLQFVMLEDGAHLLPSLEGAIGVDRPIDLRLLHKNGQTRWFAATVRRLPDDDELSGFIVSLADVHDRKMAELQLGASERRYRGLIANSRDVFAVVDESLTITFVSSNVERILQISSAELAGTSILELVAPNSAEAAQALTELSASGADGRTIELEVISGSGEARWFEVSLADGSQLGEEGWVITGRDIHATREIQKSMEEATLYDSLTGLYNRAAFQYELNNRLQALTSGQSVGVVHLDVRDFKVVNESLGFEVGDQLLIAISGRIRSGLRSDDVLARFGADSFAVLSTVNSLDELTEMGQRIDEMFTEPFETGRRNRSVALSIGLTWTADRREAPVALLEQAAIAVRRAKVAEDGAPVIYEPFMREVATERFELESDLLPGLERGEFAVVFQPLLLMSSHRVRSVEALLRWNHPERGSVSPGAFIPVAEHSGAIVELGRWVLGESCRQLKQWHDELPHATELGVGVNLSVRQLVVDGEFERLRQIILDSGVNPAKVTLELTESLMINEVPIVRRGIEDFRSLGIRIAVDDFGSGTAGLNHLRDVPFDILKIDKSYVDPLATDHDSYQLVASVVELAHSMDAKVVAEGIETPEQAALLRRMGCDIGQGFYLGRPMAPDLLEEWFAAGRDGTVASQIVSPSELERS